MSNNNTKYAAGEITSLFHGIQKTHRALGCYSFSIREPIPSDCSFSVRLGLCLSFLHSFIVPGTVLSMADRQGKSPKNASLLGPEKVKSVFSHKLWNLRMNPRKQALGSVGTGTMAQLKGEPSGSRTAPSVPYLFAMSFNHGQKAVSAWQWSAHLLTLSCSSIPQNLGSFPSPPGSFPSPQEASSHLLVRALGVHSKRFSPYEMSLRAGSTAQK